MISHLPCTLSTRCDLSSIIIEALPFVLFGCLISGIIETYLSPELVNRFLPKNRFWRIIVGIVAGFFFHPVSAGLCPSSIASLKRKYQPIPVYPFIAAPMINPVVLLATFIAFGNSFKFALLRLSGAMVMALVVGLLLAYRLDEPILLDRTKWVKGTRSSSS